MSGYNKQNRDFMKCPSFSETLKTSDQAMGRPHPSHGKSYTNQLIDLHPFAERPDSPVTEPSYQAILDKRRSVRRYDGSPMTQAQLAFMLYTAQGIQDYRGKDEAFTLRPVPSGGARHPFETYIAVKNVDGLQPGLYYYSPIANVGEKKVSLAFLGPIGSGSNEDYENRISEALANQAWAAQASVVMFLTCVPYRSEWRYKDLSHRVVLIDLGHVGQNIMLSAASLGLGSCCMAAYTQNICDEILGVDGEDEYTVYAVAVGREENY